MPKPEMVFFDAGGTLVEVRGSVGEIYAHYAAQHGLQADAAALQQSFGAAFALQPPMAFAANLSVNELDRCERAWWRKLVADVFGEMSSHPKFDAFFEDVYDAFTHASAWEIFPDVIPALQQLRAQGIRLGIISNFDSRLVRILAATELAQYFDAVYISTRCGAAKPDARIFEFALRSERIEPHQAWHIGDAWREDVEGAEQVGLRAFWLRRNEPSVAPAKQRVHLATMNDLLLIAT